MCDRARIWTQPVCLSCISSYCPSLCESEEGIQSDKRTGEGNQQCLWPCIYMAVSELFKGRKCLSISSQYGWWAGWTISRVAWSPCYSAKRLYPCPRNLRNNVQLWGKRDWSSFSLGSILAVGRQKSKWQKQTPCCQWPCALASFLP